jgi:serine/threonine protein kinase
MKFASWDKLAKFSMSAEIDSLVGKTLAERYLILSRLGEGGIGVVYKAKHLFMDRIVAVKLLKPHFVSDELSLKRFQQEAKTASCLTHQHVIDVRDFGITADGKPYLVMDYLEGCSLADQIKEHDHIEISRTLDIFSQACDGLAHAHKQGVIHRDMKPSNIMLVELDGRKDFVKIVDFGMAKLLPLSGKEIQQLTATGEVMGSPLYMSPEQCMGKSLDLRADIYSLGCSMYEALTGNPAVMGDSIYETMYKHMNEGPEPFEKSRPDITIPDQLQKLVFKATERDPAKRFQSMEEMKREIDNIDLVPRGTWPPIAGLWKTSRRLRRRMDSQRLSMLVVAIGLLTLSAGVGIAIWSNSSAVRSTRKLEHQISREASEDKLINLQMALKSAQTDEERLSLYSQIRSLLLAQSDLDADNSLLEERMQQAEEYARKAVQIQRERFSKADVRVAEHLVDLGKVVQKRGRHKEAADIFKEARELYIAAGDESGVAELDLRLRKQSQPEIPEAQHTGAGTP